VADGTVAAAAVGTLVVVEPAEVGSNSSCGDGAGDACVVAADGGVAAA
jgi:hypothetical protein